jgi:hypothetical protein
MSRRISDEPGYDSRRRLICARAAEARLGVTPELRGFPKLCYSYLQLPAFRYPAAWAAGSESKAIWFFADT